MHCYRMSYIEYRIIEEEKILQTYTSTKFETVQVQAEPHANKEPKYDMAVSVQRCNGARN